MANTGQSTRTGLYDIEMLGEFQRRYAWQHEFEFPLTYETMQVGDNEQVSFHRRRELLTVNRAEAEMSLIENVVATGDIPREYYSSHARTKTDIQQTENRVQNLEGNSARVIRSLQAAERAIDAMIDDIKQDKIKRAAGYIVARNNLWIVTNAEYTESAQSVSAIKVSMARLTGLTVSESVLPVVVGKNGVTSYVNRPQYNRRLGNMGPMKVLQSVVAY